MKLHMSRYAAGYVARFRHAAARHTHIKAEAVATMGQVVWTSKMREQLLVQMDSLRSDTDAALPPPDFQYTAIKAGPASCAFLRLFCDSLLCVETY